MHYGIALYKLSSKVGLKNKSIVWAVNGVYGFLFGGAEGACDGWGKRALNSSGGSLAKEELHHTDLTGRFCPTVHFSSHISLVTVQIHRFVWPFYHFFRASTNTKFQCITVCFYHSFGHLSRQYHGSLCIFSTIMAYEYCNHSVPCY